MANAKLRAISQFKKLQQLHLVTPELKQVEVQKQRCAHGACLSYFAKLSQKLTCLSPDKDVPIGFITGQSRGKLTLISAVEVSDYLVTDNKIDLWLGSRVRKPSDDSTTTPTRDAEISDILL